MACERGADLRGPMVPRRRLLPSLVLAGVLLIGCGGGPSEEAIERSERQFQLAEALRAEGNVAAAIEHLLEALKLDPDNWRAHVLLGYIFMERGDFEQAEAHLRKGIAVLRRLQGPTGAAMAEARNVLGVALLHEGRTDEAIEVLRASARDVLNRSPHLAWGNLGLAYMEKGDHDAAERALRQAVRMQPRFCVGYFRLGRLRMAQARWEEAEEAFTEAIEADPSCNRKYQEAWRRRGEVRARLGRREEAIEDLERCVEMGPETEHGKACRRLMEPTAEGGEEAER